MQTSFFVDMDMQRLIKEEVEWRCRLWAQGGMLPWSCHIAHVLPTISCVSSLPC